MSTETDQYNLQRVIKAQDKCYTEVISELTAGQKISHWMWFIFPQIEGLGYSDTTSFYAIKNIGEATHYLQHPILGKRFLECSKLIIASQNKSIRQILGQPDDRKLLSCMTLFSQVKGSSDMFKRIIDIFFDTNVDERTIKLLKQD